MRSLTMGDYNLHGRFSAATMKSRFGSWNQALHRCGLSIGKRNNIPQEELLNDLKHVAEELGTKRLSGTAYLRDGRFSSTTITRAFGSWAKALEAAGLEPSEQCHPRISDEELLRNLATVWETIGRKPKQGDFRHPPSCFSADSYKRRFGSLRKGLEHFVATANQLDTHDVAIFLPEIASPTAPAPRVKQRTQRDPSWRLRFLVMRRDHFTCCACGRSPATELGLVLHVDHVTPWSKGGETTLDNLQTLCETCNLGKSDLDMHEVL